MSMTSTSVSRENRLFGAPQSFADRARVRGILLLDRPWPGHQVTGAPRSGRPRSMWGDSQRFIEQYFNRFAGKYSPGKTPGGDTTSLEDFSVLAKLREGDE